MKMTEVAKRLQVTTRTLRNWKREAAIGLSPKIGRPSYSLELRIRSAKLVRENWLVQGRPGFRPVAQALKGKVPTRLVQRYVNLLKKKDRKVKYTLKANAMKMNVLKKDVIWTQDASQIGRSPSYEKVESQVIKDRSTLKVLKVSSERPTNQAGVIEALEKIKKTRGRLPLVWMTDNGPCYVGKDVEKYLEREMVIHLKNLPHTPEHNGSAEACVKELKRISRLEGKDIISNKEEALEKLVEAQNILNENRRYGSKGYRTSSELEMCTESSYNVVERKRIYEEYLKERMKLNEKTYGARRKRMCERNLIIGLLEKNGLIEITRGRGLSDNSKPEVFL